MLLSFVYPCALRKVSARAALPFFLVMTALPVHAFDLVTNGSFENNGGTGELAGGITTLAGWTVGPTIPTSNTPPGSAPFDFVVDANADSAGFTSVYSPPNIYLWGPNTPAGQGGPSNNGFTGSPDGGDFFGGDSGYATATLSQTITGLTPNDQYLLSFQWAASQFTNATAATQQDWQVTFGGTTVQTPTFNLPGQGFSGWMTYTNVFTASSASQTLTFLAQSGGPSGLPPFSLLDGVSLVDVTSSTPEPVSAFLMLGGIAGVIGVSRLRIRRKAKL